MTVYIAGPMTGVENHNMQAFDEMAEKLRAQGHDVLNPAHVARMYPNQSHAFYMRKALKRLLKADALYALPGWENSDGAVSEVINARLVGIPVFVLKDLLNGLTADYDINISVNRVSK